MEKEKIFLVIAIILMVLFLKYLYRKNKEKIISEYKYNSDYNSDDLFHSRKNSIKKGSDNYIDVPIKPEELATTEEILKKQSEDRITKVIEAILKDDWELVEKIFTRLTEKEKESITNYISKFKK